METEGNEVDRKLLQVVLKTGLGSDARRHPADGGGHKMVEVSAGEIILRARAFQLPVLEHQGQKGSRDSEAIRDPFFEHKPAIQSLSGTPRDQLRGSAQLQHDRTPRRSRRDTPSKECVIASLDSSTYSTS